MTGPGASPLSSPRLPSPPPFPEVQIRPKSPAVNDDGLPTGSPAPDEASTRRIRPGTKAIDMASGPPLIPLAQLDSPFQLQEHLKALHFYYTQPHTESTVTPITRETAKLLAEPPEGIERTLWLYELCRFLTMRVNSIVIAFFSENPPCSAQTCPEMRASEWQYLCAVHSPPKACCAIDYCCHTLDWATNILTSPKFFPSRLTLGSEMGGGAQASLRHLTNIFRRVYRIFAHAWFQHRDVFWQVEGLDGLYVFFKTVCDVYNLIPEDNWTIPPEAEGEETRPHKSEEGQKMTILRKEDRLNPEAGSDRGPSSLGMGATTRRHRHSPSTGAAVSTITETAEDEDSTRNTSRMSVIGRPQSRDSLLERESHAAVEEVSATVASEAPEEVPEATDDATTALPEKITDKEPVETANFSHSVVSPTLKSNSIPDDVNEKEADESEAAAAETVGEPQGPELDSKRNTEHNPAFLPELEDEPENIQKSEEEPEDQPEQGCESEMEPEESIHRLEEPTGHDVECEPKKLKEPEDPPKDQSEDDTTHGPETGAETSPESQEASSQEQQKEQEGTDNENEKQEPKSEEDTAPSEEQALETEPSDDSLAEPKEVSEEASNVSREDNNETAPEEEKSSQVTTEGDSDPLGESQPSPKITPQEEEKTEKT